MNALQINHESTSFDYHISSGICCKVQACESSIKQFRKVFIMFGSTHVTFIQFKSDILQRCKLMHNFGAKILVWHTD